MAKITGIVDRFPTVIGFHRDIMGGDHYSVFEITAKHDLRVGRFIIMDEVGPATFDVHQLLLGEYDVVDPRQGDVPGTAFAPLVAPNLGVLVRKDQRIILMVKNLYSVYRVFRASLGGFFEVPVELPDPPPAAV
jgi:hypothetical protein